MISKLQQKDSSVLAYLSIPNLLTTLLCFLFVLQIQAQDTTYYKLDTGYQTWVPSTKEAADYFRPLPLKKEGALFKIEDYYINGNLQMSGLSSSEERDLFEGLVTWYYSDGTVQKTANYSEDRRNGMETYYYKDGSVQKTTNYLEGRRNGMHIYYYQDGNIKLKGFYDDNRPMNGTFYQELDGGFDSSIGSHEIFEYKNNKIIGGITTYVNSQQIAIRAFKNIESETIQVIYYDRKGEKIGESNRSFDDKNNRGIRIDFYRDIIQVVGIEAIYKYTDDGQLEQITYYDRQGNITGKGIFKNGDRYEGIFYSWNNRDRYTYKNGVMDGPVIYYNYEKEEIARGIYKNDKPWEGQFLDGGISSYKNGVLDGKQITYFDPGDYKKVERYFHLKDEKKDGEAVQFDEEGNILFKGIYKNDLPWEGNFREELGYRGYKVANYSGGKVNGPVTEYNMQDAFISEKEFKDGVATGWETNMNPETKTKHRALIKYTGDQYQVMEGEYFYSGALEFHKSGHLIKRIKYEDDYETPKKIEQFAILSKVDKDTDSQTERTETIVYEDGKEYKLTYKNGQPFNGIYRDYNHTINYINGKKEGKFIRADGYPSSLMIANYENDLIQGNVLFVHGDLKDTTVCLYRDSFPYEGISYADEVTFTYENGKKNGESYFNVYSTASDYMIGVAFMGQLYKDDLLDGRVVYFDDDNNIIEEALHKNGLPYEGNFYDFDNKEKMRYSQGKLVEYFYQNDNLIFNLQYENGQLIKTIITEKDKEPIIGIYKNGLPFEGRIYEQLRKPNKSAKKRRRSLDYYFTVSTYKNGKKDGSEKDFEGYGERVVLEKIYKNGALMSITHFDFMFRGQEKISLTYKNGLPYSGLQKINNERLLILSTYENGAQIGYEYYMHNTQTSLIMDSLYFEEGLPHSGAQLESIHDKIHKHIYQDGQRIESRTYEYLSHHNKQSYSVINGQQVETTVSALTNDVPTSIVKYTQNGYHQKFTNKSKKIYDQIKLNFSDDSQTSGIVSYTKEGSVLSTIEFLNRQIKKLDLTKTHPKIFLDEKGKTYANDTLGTIVYRFYPSLEFSIPPSYQYFMFDRNSRTEEGTVFTFFPGATLPICSFDLKYGEIYNGTFIEPDSNDTYDYSIYEDGQRILKENNLRLEELIEKVKKF